MHGYGLNTAATLPECKHLRSVDLDICMALGSALQLHFVQQLYIW